MRLMLHALLLVMAAGGAGNAQPADCPVEPSTGPTLPLSLDLAGRPGVPAGMTGQGYIAVPMSPPGVACRDAPPPPSDVLHGEPGAALGAPSRDMLRGPGGPHVRIEIR